MRKNFKLTIEYDGSGFYGWQRQKNDRTVQGVIEAAIATMTGETVTLIGSGRTDAGVHARGQVANFLCETELTAPIFERGLNSLLSEDVVVRYCHQVDESFHARYSVKSKIYQYRILNRVIPVAVGRQYCWFIRRNIDVETMRAAAGYIVGSHDFKAFEGAGSPRSSTIRQVIRAEWQMPKPDQHVFEIEADGFLRYMVRNLVGTLVQVGLGKLTPEDFKGILFSTDRNQAGATAPPQGLFLMEVKY
ncbi:MAG: tRNA pseudouridine(38-40) synthase TruA [Desulfobacterales bacterium]|nr:tRNA pseudouridine(38-40) synthase TruA [Desulfobacterales bacterium]